MNAIDCHDGEIGLNVLLIENARVFEERLINDSEIVGVKLRLKTNALHNVHESPFKLTEEFTIA